MNYLKDFLASIGVIALLVLGMTGATAGAGKIADAFERQDTAQVTMIELHKLDYPTSDDDNYVTDPMNGFDDEVVDVYETSTEAKTARHANLFISNAYGRE